MKKFELGDHVVAKRDFPINWDNGMTRKKVADVKAGMRGIVCGFDERFGGVPIVNIIDYQMPTGIGGEYFWEKSDWGKSNKNDSSKYMVWRKGTGRIEYEHETQDSARAEAERVARLCPGQKVYVLKQVSVVDAKDVNWVNLEEDDLEIPF